MKEVNKNFAQEKKNMTMLNKLSTDSVDFLPVVKWNNIKFMIWIFLRDRIIEFRGKNANNNWRWFGTKHWGRKKNIWGLNPVMRRGLIY